MTFDEWLSANPISPRTTKLQTCWRLAQIEALSAANLSDAEIDATWDEWLSLRGFQARPVEARREFARAIIERLKKVARSEGGGAMSDLKQTCTTCNYTTADRYGKPLGSNALYECSRVECPHRKPAGASPYPTHTTRPRKSGADDGGGDCGQVESLGRSRGGKRFCHPLGYVRPRSRSASQDWRDTMSEDPDEIFLQPACCADPEVGRLWCEDDAPEDCDAGNPWVRYIHVDKYAELKAEVEALREDAERLDFLHDQCSVTFTFKRPDGTSAMIGGPTNLRVAIDAALAARPGGETNVP